MDLERSFAGLSFSYVGPLRPERDERGEVIEELPQSRYRNQRNLPLHRYGKGPFWRFRVARGWRSSGVYVLTGGDEALYVRRMPEPGRALVNTRLWPHFTSELL